MIFATHTGKEDMGTFFLKGNPNGVFVFYPQTLVGDGRGKVEAVRLLKL